MQGIRHIAKLNHLRHVLNILSCLAHVKLLNQDHTTDALGADRHQTQVSKSARPGHPPVFLAEHLRTTRVRLAPEMSATTAVKQNPRIDTTTVESQVSKRRELGAPAITDWRAHGGVQSLDFVTHNQDLSGDLHVPNCSFSNAVSDCGGSGSSGFWPGRCRGNKGLSGKFPHARVLHSQLR